MKKLLYMTTVSISADKLLHNQLRFFVERQYETFVATAFKSKSIAEKIERRENVKSYNIPLEREIKINKDIVALYQTWSLIRTLRPHITNVSTPKAGLIGGLAAKLSSVPVRIYTLRGLRLETVTGPKRYLLHYMEWLACACAHRVVCVSPSLRDRIVQLRLASSHKAVVLGFGSSNGLDGKRFLPSPELEQQAAELRVTLDLPPGTPTIGFVGRFVRDKGIHELVEAFGLLYAANPQLRLLLLGDYEEGDPVSEKVRQVINTHPGMITPGFVTDIAPYYLLMDMLAFPTYREGYPNAPLEAAAAGKPVVASDATGAIDAVEDGITGISVPVGDSKALAAALKRLLEDKKLAQELGKAGQERVLRDFQPHIIWQALNELYQELLTEAQGRQGKQLKRLMDVVAAGTGLVILAAPMAMLALAVRVKLGTPILFQQQRPGLKGYPFTMYKFRTMTDRRDNAGQLLPDAQRLTPFGNWLRATSLDELPELANVLKGDMSLVGPRPLLIRYTPFFSAEERQRLDVRPGITGWAQVNGRNTVSWDERLALDVWYVQHMSSKLDLRVLWLTLIKVFKRSGVVVDPESIMQNLDDERRSRADL